MTRGTIVLGSMIFCVGIAHKSAAWANNWTISSFFQQNFGADTNINLTEGESGSVTPTSRTSLGATFRLERENAIWSLSPGVSYTAAGGRDNSISGFDSVNPRFNGAVFYRRPDYTVRARVTVVPDLVSFSQVDDTGRTSSDTIELTTFGSASIDVPVNQLNSASFSVNGRLRTFTENDDALVDNYGLGASAGWNRTVTDLTRVRLSGSVQYFEADDAENRRSVSYSLRGRVSTRLSPDISLTGSLGAAFTESYRDVATADGGRQTVRDTSYTVGPVGDLGFSYALTRDTRFSAGLSQTIDQNSDGVVVNRARVRANLRTQIDERNAVNFGFNFSFQNPLFSGDGDLDVASDRNFSFTPSYSYDLDPDWALTVGYRLRAREEEGDVRISNGVFLSISRGFQFLN